MDLSTYIQIGTAFELLLRPMGEIAIHDLNSGKIAWIAGNLSGRSVGEDSLLEVEQDFATIDRTVFSKINFDGRLIKFISIPIKENGRVQALMCINCDVSVFNQMKLLAEKCLPIAQEEPSAFFKNDWKERIHIAIHSEINAQQWAFHTLTQAQKKHLAHVLFVQGAFAEKNATDYIAQVLQMGRATLFTYLKNWKTKS